jgi:hypothetical protein
MKLDLADKAFVLASDAGLLKAFQARMGIMGGTATDSVRKLGVDYALSASGSARSHVRSKRLKRRVARWRRLCKAGLRNHGARVVYSGILPHMLFGAGLHKPSAQDIRKVQVVVSGVGLKRPLGTSAGLVESVDRMGRSAPFQFIREALSRWAREVWLLGHGHRPLDALTAREVVSAAQAVEHQAWQAKSNGPLQALASALGRMGWQFIKGGTVFRTGGGQEIELPVTSPTEVVRVAWEEYQARLFEDQVGRLAARHDRDHR